MSLQKTASKRFAPPATIPLVAVYLFYLNVVLRTLAEPGELGPWLPVYLGVECLFGVIFTLTLWHPIKRPAWQHVYFIFQSLLGIFLVILHPHLDFTNVLLVILSYQAALVFKGRALWIWVSVLLLLIILSLTITLGFYGLALSFLPATVTIVFPAYISITQEIKNGTQKRAALLVDLQHANEHLTAYAGQVEELSAIQERSRLARELHDSVSQTMFSISLHSRSARILLERDPDQLQSHLANLQTLTQNALVEMRSLIADLRPLEGESAERPTS